MADFTKPDVNSNYTTAWTELHNLIDSVVKMLNGTTDTNIPDGAIRWNSSAGKFEIYDSSTSTWNDLASQYNINVQQLQGKTPTDFVDASHVGSGGSAHATATGSTPGFMSASDKAKLDTATNSASPLTLIMRDIYGRAKVAAPSASDDIARKAEVDAVQSDLYMHKTSGDHDNRYVLSTGGTYTGTFDFSSLLINGNNGVSTANFTQSVGASTSGYMYINVGEGKIIQAGKVGQVNLNNGYTVAFPYTFPNYLIGMAIVPWATTDIRLRISSYSSSNFTVYGDGLSGFMWIAFGY